MNDRLLKPIEAAGYLGVTVQHLADRRFKHQAPVYVKIGAAVRYRETDLIDFVNASTVHPAKDTH